MAQVMTSSSFVEVGPPELLGKPCLPYFLCASHARQTGVHMSSGNIALLGAIAGFTIYLGLPLGRLRTPTPGLKAGLNAVAIGILIFLVWDVLTHAWEPVDEALGKHSWATVASGGFTLVAGLTIGLAGLVHYDAWIARRRETA